MNAEIEPDMESRVALTHRPVGQSVVMRQCWDHLLFLHWPIAQERIQRQLPPGLMVDTFEGNAYLGVVPFTMRDIHPVWSPSVPGLSAFPEINVRTYVHFEGKPGVLFFSLDAANPIAVQLARRLFHLPYYDAKMRREEIGDGSIRYTSWRCHRGQPPTETDLRYTPTGTPQRALPGTMEYFLCERYLLYAYQGKRLYRGRVYHTAYPLQEAILHDFSDTLVEAAGFAGVSEVRPPLIHYAAGVSVDVFGLQGV